MGWVVQRPIQWLRWVLESFLSQARAIGTLRIEWVLQVLEKSSSATLLWRDLLWVGVDFSTLHPAVAGKSVGILQSLLYNARVRMRAPDRARVIGFYLYYS